jgi:hypothetical protein
MIHFRIIKHDRFNGIYFMARLFSTVIILVIIALSVYGQSSSKTIELWNGKDFTGWKFVTNSAMDIKSVCTMKPDSVLVIAGKSIGYLVTTDSYENYKLHLEYRWPQGAAQNSNSGVLIHIASGPIDRNTWPL